MVTRQCIRRVVAAENNFFPWRHALYTVGSRSFYVPSSYYALGACSAIVQFLHGIPSADVRYSLSFPVLVWSL